MRRVIRGTFLAFIVMIMSAAAFATGVFARDETLFIQAGPEASTIDGSWRLMGAGAPGTPAEDPMLATFAPDGTATISSRAVRPALPGMPFSYIHFSTGHGVWEQGDDGTVSFTVVHLRSDEAGVFRGSVTVSGTLTLGADGQSVTGDATYTVADPAGAVQGTIPTPLTGERIAIGAPASATPKS